MARPPDPLIPLPQRLKRQVAAFNKLLVRDAIRQAVDRIGATPTPAVEAHLVTLYVEAAARHGERRFRIQELRDLLKDVPAAVPRNAVMDAMSVLDFAVLRHVRTELATRRTKRGRRTRKLRAAQQWLTELSFAPHAGLEAELRALTRTGRREAATEYLVQHLAKPTRVVGLTEEMRQLVDLFRQAGMRRRPAATLAKTILRFWHALKPEDLTEARILARVQKRHPPAPPRS